MYQLHNFDYLPEHVISRMDFCCLFWLPGTWPLLIMFEEFPVLSDLRGGIAHLLLHEENARYLPSQDSLQLEEWARG